MGSPKCTVLNCALYNDTQMKTYSKSRLASLLPRKLFLQLSHTRLYVCVRARVYVSVCVCVCTRSPLKSSARYAARTFRAVNSTQSKPVLGLSFLCAKLLILVRDFEFGLRSPKELDTWYGREWPRRS